MSEKQEQSDPATVLIIGLMGLAQHFAPELELAAKSAEEDPIEHALRLLDGVSAGAESFVSDAEARSVRLIEVTENLAARDGQLQDAQAENAGLKRQVSAQKGQAAKARADHDRVAEQLGVALERAPASLNPRKLPEDPPSIDKGESAELLELVGVADSVEIVAFMEGVEALGVPPLLITADVPVPLRVGFAGVVLGVERWRVTGPAVFDGWALFLDGELAAYRKRDAGQLTIGAGQIFDLAGDVLL